LGELLSDQDAARSRRVMQAMLKMVKLDIKELKQAAQGK
jgi:predicted 3-demethylubiquinone-9 3-methyltransferase (glyoxalase superfamily)